MAFAVPRPRHNLREPSQSRDSNALRASVLEAALELGISSSRAVADLIFNTVDEEDEVRIPFSTALCSLPAFFFSFLQLYSFSDGYRTSSSLGSNRSCHTLTPRRLTVSAVILLAFCRASLRRLRKTMMSSDARVPRTEITSHSK